MPLDFDTLERVSGDYISDDLRARADDIVWRVRCGSRRVYLLIEFQSRVDTFMAVRVLAYVALLYQDLIRAQDREAVAQGSIAIGARPDSTTDPIAMSSTGPNRSSFVHCC